ncbi:4-oxalomesaconate tautomerase [Cupriavidus neocaledonicus]|uniref:4-oxalomesaconate tautomerase n=1 Tax=Cupriavidus neocaledonicus TaxID=1040979 RepID=A0A375HSM8_9BURK|nr:4-oxalomesaconate tautomerase [Cupriavidus neocaledonicus]SOZ39747.1 4-oxalomesaconate tautomerase [Cupriavidus neocaledonicus]SPD60922.1 4-oxalomesaconate tautomerase [Cupriavidus neocaledonicus]
MTPCLNSDLRAIPCTLMRGGTSRGPFFLASDLPAETAARDRVLLAAMGSPDPRQIDGLGGAHPLTSKAGIVAPGKPGQADLDFTFAQLQPNADTVDTTPNCGNMLAAVLPYAIERGLVAPQGDFTRARVLTRNTGMLCDVTMQTPQGVPRFCGDARIDGVPGTASPIVIAFLDTAGSVCSALLPTGNATDRLTITDPVAGKPLSIHATLIDNGMPMVLMRAADLNRTARESVADLNSDTPLKQRIEALRLVAGEMMGLGNVAQKSYPKMCLIAAPRTGGSIATRCFIPRVCHDAIGVLAAITVGTACVLPGTVAEGVAVVGAGPVHAINVEHPTGDFAVELETHPADPGTILRSALIRTARPIMRGEVLVPASAWLL